jgi:hypothetical protein
MGRCCTRSRLLLVLHRSQPDPGFLGRLPVSRGRTVFLTALRLDSDDLTKRQRFARHRRLREAADHPLKSDVK